MSNGNQNDSHQRETCSCRALIETLTLERRRHDSRLAPVKFSHKESRFPNFACKLYQRSNFRLLIHSRFGAKLIYELRRMFVHAVVNGVKVLLWTEQSPSHVCDKPIATAASAASSLSSQDKKP